MALRYEYTQPLREMNTKNLPEGKGRPANEADTSQLSVRPRKYGNLDVLQPYGRRRPVTMKVFTFYLYETDCSFLNTSNLKHPMDLVPLGQWYSTFFVRVPAEVVTASVV
jgi:hypothetical protein